MKRNEILELVRLGGATAPYGVRRLARCYDIEDLARIARRSLPAGALGYLEGGGEDEWTLRRNREAFSHYELLPHVLNDVSHIDTERTVLGFSLPVPVLLSPIGAPRLFHHEGELAVARAARKAGLPYGISTLATETLANIAAEAGGSPLILQLYLWGDRSETREMMATARDLGFRGLVLTVDSTVRSKRDRELERGIVLPVPSLTLRTVLEGALHPRWAWHFLTTAAPGFPNLSRVGPVSRRRIATIFDGTVSWSDLDWIRQEWEGPLLVKGVMRADDARRAAEVGVDGIVVSNHGGRELDHCPATLEVLPEIVDVAADRAVVLLDSGIRRGSDIVTALALGARAVFVGRAYLYGLAAAGEAGVCHAIDILSEEIRISMALCGVASLDEITPDLVRRVEGLGPVGRKASS